MNGNLDPVLIDRVHSLENCCSCTLRIVSEGDFNDFLARETRQLALAMAIIQISETAGRIIQHHPGYHSEYSKWDLTLAYAMRNRLVHGYDGSDPGVIWETAITSVPELRGHVASFLRSIGDDLA